VKSPVCFNYEIDSKTGHRFVNHTFDQARQKYAFFLVLFTYFDRKLIAGPLLSSYFVTERFRACVMQLGYGWVYTSNEILTIDCFSGIRMSYCGPGSSVGVATDYGVDGPGIESRCGEIFRTYPHRLWDPPSLLYSWYRVFPGGKVRPGRSVDHSPPSSAEVMEE
jgi:hypothetical protein